MSSRRAQGRVRTVDSAPSCALRAVDPAPCRELAQGGVRTVDPAPVAWTLAQDGAELTIFTPSRALDGDFARACAASTVLTPSGARVVDMAQSVVVEERIC